MTWTFFSTGKSGKREVAVSLLMLWAFITSYVFFWIPVEQVKDYADAWSTLTWAVLMWAAAAFGIDFVAKKMGGFGGQQSEPAPRVPLRRSADQSQPRRHPDDGIE